MLKNRQVFKVIQLKDKRCSFLYVCANSRQEIMELLTRDHNELLDSAYWKEIRNSPKKPLVEELYQIIRILEEDLDKEKIEVLTDLKTMNFGTIDTSSFRNIPFLLQNSSSAEGISKNNR